MNWRHFLLLLLILLILAALSLFLPVRRQPWEESKPRPTVLQKTPLEKPHLEEARVPGTSRPTVVTSPDTFAPGADVKRLKVYEITSGFASLEKGKEWARRFGFTVEPEPESDVSYQWLSDGYRLFRYNLKTNAIEYYSQPKSSPAGQPAARREDLQAEAVKVLLDLGLFKKKEDFEIVSYRLLKAVGSEYSRVPDFTAAGEVLFYTRPLLNGLPVIVGEMEISPTLLDLDKYGRVRQLIHHLQDFSPKEKGEYPLKSPADAAKEVGEGKGTIISVGGGGYEVPNLKAIVLDGGVELAYLYPKVGDLYLQPVYVFSGSSRTVGRKVVGVKIVVPAIH